MPHRRSGGQNLRHGIDRQTRQDTVMHRAHRQRVSQKRQKQHDRHAQNRGEGDGGAYIVAIGFDHGGDRSDRGIAADPVAAGDQ